MTEAAQAGIEAVSLGGDLADPQTPERLIHSATAALGPIDLLSCNAGHAAQHGYADLDLDTWERTLAVNLRSPFLLTQQALPGMTERRYGRVLLVSSAAAFTGGIVGPHYAASKAGLHGLVHHLATRVAAYGVTVNALAPALVADTGMLPVTADPHAVPVGRFGRPDEVADLAMAILRNGYLTNHVLSLDGGGHPR